MEIYIRESTDYLNYSIRKDLENKGNDPRASLVGVSDAAVDQLAKNDSSKANETGLRAMDRVDISAEARQLQKVLSGEKHEAQTEQDSLGRQPEKQQSALHNVAAGNGDEAASRAGNSKLLAYSENARPSGSAPADEDVNEQLRELKKQLQEAMNRLTEAQNKLGKVQGEAQAETEEVAANSAPQGKDAKGQAEAAAKASQQAAGMSAGNNVAVDAAQQEVTMASAEVMEIQQQIQNLLSEQQQSGSGGGNGTASLNPTAGRTWSPQGTTNFNVGG